MTGSSAAAAGIDIRRIETFVFRAPIMEPILTSFGTIPERAALLLRVEDADGAHGWGEVWCNFPPYGAENKARLIESIVGPAALAGSFAGPADAWHRLTAKMHRWSLQIGEPGPIAACLAGLDLALWDLDARRRGIPVWRALGLEVAPALVPAYASGLNPGGAVDTVARCRAEGFRGFKLKVAFDLASDLDNVRRITEGLGPGERLMVDANQGWDLDTARPAIAALGACDLGWIEEPVPVDRPTEEWAELAMLSPVPLAGGENMYGFAAFDAAIRAGHLAVIQPDLCKWGGLTGCVAVARRAVAAGRSYCPHWLGSGLGHMAAMHALAAVGGPGLLETDINENPLREAMAQPYPTLVDGGFRLPDGPGFGVEPDLAALKPRMTAYRELTA